MTSPIFPRLACNWPSAPIAGFSGLPVGVQILREVSGLAVYVFVLLIKTCPTLFNRLRQDISDVRKEFSHFF